MALRLYMDAHVPRAITVELRTRGIDVLTAIEDGADELLDDALLQPAHPPYPLKAHRQGDQAARGLARSRYPGPP